MKLPIRLRLTLVYCAVFFALIAVLEAGTYVSVRTAMHSLVDRELETRLSGIDDHLSRHIDKQPWTQLHDSLAVHPAFQPELFYMRRADGTVLFQGGAFSAIPSSLDFAETPRLETLDGTGNILRVLAIRKTIKGTAYDLLLGTDLLVPTAILGHVWLVMLISIPLVLLLASAAGYWIAGRALAPVSGIILAARSIDSSRLNQRLEVPDTGDEIRLLAETINKMLGRIEDGFRHVQQFTANASHELRTPAAIIRASAEVALLKSPANERTYKDALHRILREAERNSALLENLLQLARCDSRTDRPELQAVDLVQCLAQACAQLAPLAESKQLQLRPPVAHEHAWILSSEDHLRRLWLILLENAVKYTPPGGNISVTVETIADGRCCCSITDTGIGIAPEHLPNIFERFYRADKARSRADGGTGLGLSIARELAGIYDASIEVESVLGTGSRFSVTFPLQARIKSISSAYTVGEAVAR